jgi:replication factor A1
MKGNDGNPIKVVLWGKDEDNIPKIISVDAKVRLLGVRTKSGIQALEVHGNESTIIEIEGKQEAEPITFRIISMTKLDSGKTMILGVDNQKRLFNISDSSENFLQFKENDMIECMPSKVFGNSITLDENSFVRKLDDDSTVPNKSDLRTKISDIKVDESYCVEAIILKIPERKQVQTKNGESILLSEMYVEDDSGQIWIKGWRNQARLIDKCSIGEIISVTGVNAKSGLEGRIELFLSPFSIISKKN